MEVGEKEGDGGGGGAAGMVVVVVIGELAMYASIAFSKPSSLRTSREPIPSTSFFWLFPLPLFFDEQEKEEEEDEKEEEG